MNSAPARTFHRRFARLAGSKTVKDSAALYAGRGATLLIGMLSTIIYGVIFPTTQIAVLSLFDMVLQLAVTFGFSWSALGLTRFGKEEWLDHRSMNKTSTTRLVLMAPILVGLSLGTFIFRDALLRYIGTEDTTVPLLLLAMLYAEVGQEHLRHLYQTVERHRVNAAMSVVGSLLKLLLLAAFFFGWIDIRAEVYIRYAAGISIAMLALTASFARREYLAPWARVSRAEWTGFLSFVFPQILGFAGLYVINWIDVYFIRQYCSMDELGAYQFLYSLFAKLCSFAILLNILFFPKIVAWKRSHPERVRALLRSGPLLALLLASAGCGLLLALYPPAFTLLFGSKYDVADPAFRLLLATVPFHFAIYLVVPVLNSHDRVAYVQAANLAAALLNLAMDYFLVRSYGSLAAATATYVAYMVKYALLLWGASRVGSVRLAASTVAMGALTTGVVFYLLHCIS